MNGFLILAIAMIALLVLFIPLPPNRRCLWYRFLWYTERQMVSGPDWLVRLFGRDEEFKPLRPASWKGIRPLDDCDPRAKEDWLQLSLPKYVPPTADLLFLAVDSLLDNTRPFDSVSITRETVESELDINAMIELPSNLAGVRGGVFYDDLSRILDLHEAEAGRGTPLLWRRGCRLVGRRPRWCVEMAARNPDGSITCGFAGAWTFFRRFRKRCGRPPCSHQDTQARGRIWYPAPAALSGES